MVILRILLRRVDELLMNMPFRFYILNKPLLHPIIPYPDQCFKSFILKLHYGFGPLFINSNSGQWLTVRTRSQYIREVSTSSEIRLKLEAL